MSQVGDISYVLRMSLYLRKWTTEQIIGILWDFNCTFIVEVEFQKPVYLFFPQNSSGSAITELD